MCNPILPTFVRALVLSVPLWTAATAASAQATAPPDLANMSLEDLMSVRVVSAASKFLQEIKEAPASITVVTKDDIRRYGHRTLADVLRSVRGFYTTYDRNYAYVGMRGFSRPGDYNTRFLLLIDGQRQNDNIYDMAPIGTDFPLDVSLIDRVEVIRGPGSSLYGTNAFFGVINVVTRTGSQSKGLTGEASGGSLGTRSGAATYGKVFDNGREVLVSGTMYRSDGAKELFYPEFDADEIGSGVARGLDGDRSSSAFASAALGRFTFRAGLNSRSKAVPTAAFDTVFGDDRHSATDNRAFVNASFEGSIGRGWSANARAAYDYYGYKGFYPYDYGEPEPVMWVDVSTSHSVSAELTARRRISGRQLLTVGAEVRHQVVGDQTSEDNTGLVVDVRQPETMIGAYIQDEVRLAPWLIVNGGLRADRHPAFGTHGSPRVGAVLLPRPATSIKLLYGSAFRAPNPYERYYYRTMIDRSLGPETIHNTEVVWEESLSTRVRTVLTAFKYRTDNIIEQGGIETDWGPDIYFRNIAGVDSAGIEAEVEVNLLRGFTARASHTFADTTDSATGAAVSNSPRHVAKFAIQVPIAGAFISLDSQYVGERLTLGGEALPAFFLPNLTVTTPASRRLDLSVSVYNLFGTSFADPGGEEHLQESIAQDGRTALVRMRVRF